MDDDNDMPEIVRLQVWLDENRNNNNDDDYYSSSKDNRIRPRTASVVAKARAAAEKEALKEREIVGLLEEGYNADDVSYILEVPFPKVAYIEENYKKKGNFYLLADYLLKMAAIFV